WICAGAAMADDLAATTQPAPAAATATHAMAATTVEAASTANQPSAATVASAAPVTAAVTTAPAPAASTAPAATTTAIPAEANTGPTMPVRGMSMENVEHIFGAPQEKLPAVPDPSNKLHPPITRWVYPEYVVYFEYNLVIHTVVKEHPFNSDQSKN
ncbi:MAG: hypothetical protein KGJ08_09250, partial [Gammaproteobacteria bacterium]|nr:hypothetical protein [Gammaproteobacteria bacterium]